MSSPPRAVVALVVSAILLCPTASAQAKSTLACYPAPKAAPRRCVVFALPGPVIRQPRVSLRSLRWKHWGTRRTTGTGRLLRDGIRVRVRIIADQRLSTGTGGSFYSRLTLIDQSGHRQSFGLDSYTESS